jgi:hypothetical protein
MTPQEIEKEIQARVEFKLNELLTGVKNRVGFKYKAAFDMTRESEYAWKAFKELEEMLHKEINMPTPRDNMAIQKKWEAKQFAVEKIEKSLDLRGRRDYDDKIRVIVAAIETAQNY